MAKKSGRVISKTARKHSRRLAGQLATQRKQIAQKIRQRGTRQLKQLKQKAQTAVRRNLKRIAETKIKQLGDSITKRARRSSTVGNLLAPQSTKRLAPRKIRWTPQSQYRSVSTRRGRRRRRRRRRRPIGYIHSAPGFINPAPGII